MEFTGFDNIIKGSKSFNEVIGPFELALKKYWPKMIIDDSSISDTPTDNRQERFYAKDQKMLDTHDELGFHTNANGQGCLYLIITHKNEIWEYTLVTPESIEKEGFSQYMFKALATILKNRDL